MSSLPSFVNEPKQRSPVWVLVSILALAFILRIGFIVLFPLHDLADGRKYQQIAVNMLEGKGYTLNGKTPDIRHPPGYPLFIAGLYVVFGGGILTVQVAQALLGVVLCWMVYRLGVSLWGDFTGLVGAGLVALYPPLIYVSRLLMAESLYTTFLVGMVLALVVCSPGRREVTGGVALGATVLTRAVAKFLLPVILLADWRSSRKRATARRLALLFAITLLVVAPWTVRNYVQGGSMDRTMALQAGHNFFLSTYFPSKGRLPVDEVEREKFRQVSRHVKFEKYPDLFPQRALVVEGLKNVREHPLFYLEVLARNVGRFWCARNTGRYELPIALMNGLVLILAAVGLMRSRPWPPGVILMLAVIAYFWLLHTVTVANVRYSLPITPLVLIFTAQGLKNLSGHFFSRTANVRAR